MAENIAQAENTLDGPEGTAGTVANEPAVNTDGNQAAKPEITTDDVLAFLKQQGGIEIESLDALKEKVSYVPPPAPLTDHEKQIKALEDEHALEKFFVETNSVNGNAEQARKNYNDLKAIASADVIEIGKQALSDRLIAKGYTGDLFEEEFTRLSGGLTDEQISQIEDPEERQRAVKRKEIAIAALKKEGEDIKKAASDKLNSVGESLKKINLEKELKSKYSTTAVGLIQSLEKQNIEMGELNGEKLSPIDYVYGNDEKQKTMQLLSDPEGFADFALNEDGTPNIENLAPIFLKAFSAESLAKAAYIKGMSFLIDKKLQTEGTPPPLPNQQQKQSKSGEKILQFVGFGQRPVNN